MGKSLYSLILTDEVVREIDNLSSRVGGSRSSLVDRILADYVAVSTPEKEIESILSSMEKLFAGAGDLIPFVTPGQLSMSMKSSLEYKYRPTLRYSVHFFKIPSESFGELSLTFRTQSRSLLSAMAGFFGFWKRLEDAYVSEFYEEGALYYGLTDSKFTRSLAVPLGKSYGKEDVSLAVSSYVKTFDGLLKGFLCGRFTEKDVEKEYVRYLNSGAMLI